MNNFQQINQTDSMIPVNQIISQNSMNQYSQFLKNQAPTFEKSTNQSSWQNSTRKGTVKADEDFEFQGFPKPPPEFFPPPPTSPASETQAVQVQSSLPSSSISPTKQFQDHQPVEIKRIPLIFKGTNFY